MLRLQSTNSNLTQFNVPLGLNKVHEGQAVNRTETEGALPSQLTQVANTSTSFSQKKTDCSSLFMKYESIRQFKDILPILYSATHPVKLTGQPKIHGTNSGVTFDFDNKKIAVQSRNRILTPKSDNFGFAAYVNQEKVKAFFNEVFNNLEEIKEPNERRVAVFGEWFGEGIQKDDIAVKDLPKTLMVFDIIFYNGNGEITRRLNEEGIERLIQSGENKSKEEIRIFCFNKKQQHQIYFDPKDASKAMKEINTLTKQTEDKCEVGQMFGLQGRGEGYVWRFNDPENENKTVLFKTKNQFFSETKGAETITDKQDKVNSSQEFAALTVTDHRLQKLLHTFKDKGNEIILKNTNTFCELVINDILTEEDELLKHSKLKVENVKKAIGKIANPWYRRNIDKDELNKS